MNVSEAFRLGRRYRLAGDLQHAEYLYREILKIEPENSIAYYELGTLFQAEELFDEAMKCYQKAIQYNPKFAGAFNGMGNVSKRRRRFDEAIDYYQEALNIEPDLAEALNNLGGVFQAKGQFDEALAYFRRAARKRPDNYNYCRNFIFSMLYSPQFDARSIFLEHVEVAKRFEGLLSACVVRHASDRTVNRRLKIGYVSPDFRRHSVAYFIEPVLASHDRENFEIYCYSLMVTEDEVTARLRKYADHWKSISGMQDDQAAELIRKDRIDILVDLAGHAYNGRILLFMRKPAPVQASWIGYPATTGLSAMNYKIVDSYTDPRGMTERLYSENLIRLPESFLCYLPDRDCPDVGALPSLASGEITFGSFNDFAKETPEVVALWSAILKRVPDSLLILKAMSFTDRDIHRHVKDMFARQDVASDQIELLPFSPSFSDHLNVYNNVDIGLDTFPYNGTATTCEALWMGVPVITLAGNTHVSRVGVSLLSNLGLGEFIAGTTDEYVEIAVRLAADIDKLRSLREALRQMMKNSPLMNARQFTVDLENCYRTMWENWCRDGK
jgi:protein O-GlcNAc transferase